MEDYKVTFFSLKNDKDTAIVRFPYATEAQVDADKITTHKVKIKLKDKEFDKRVKCVRTVNDSIDTCPLCASGDQAITRLFTKVITYVKQADGSFKPQAAIWERPLTFADDIKGKIKDLTALTGSGDLSKHLFIVTRNGVAGDKGTRYSLDLAPKDIYRDDIFKADFSGFNDFNTADSFICWTKSAADLTEFVKTGKFPYSRPMQQAPANNITGVTESAGQPQVIVAPPVTEPIILNGGVTTVESLGGTSFGSVVQPSGAINNINVNGAVQATPIQPVALNGGQPTVAIPAQDTVNTTPTIGVRYNY